MGYVVDAVWTALPGEEATVRGALEDLARLSRQEPGNRYYQPYQSLDEPAVFRIFEVYEDEAAFRAHAESPHFQQYALGVAIPRLAGRERTYFHTIGERADERSPS